MKRLLLILCAVSALALLGGVDVYAQSKKVKEKPKPVKLDPIFYKAGKFTVGYDVLDPSKYRNFFSPEEFQRVNNAFKMRRDGTALMITGGAAIGVSAVFMGVGNSLWHEDDMNKRQIGYGLWWGGVGLLCAGSSLLVAGIPVYCIADSRLKKVAQGYNQRNNLALSVGLGQYGPGLAFSF